MAVSAWDTRYDTDAVTTPGTGSPGQGLEADEAVADQVRLALGPGGVVHDLVDLLAPAVVAAQDGAVLVGHLGPGRDDLAHERPVAADVLLGEGPVAGVGEVAVQQGGEVGVEAVPVQAGGLLEFGVVGEHSPMLRPKAPVRGPVEPARRAFI